MKVLTAEQTRLAERAAFKMGMSGERLMENAGSAAMRVIKEHFDPKDLRVVVVAGQGNNGGDGFVVARKLKEYGARVSVIMAMGLAVTPDSSLMLSRARQAQVTVVNYYDDTDLCDSLIASADLIVDGIFGIGFHGAPDRDVSVIIEKINKSKAKKAALDIPSGVAADSGEVLGSAIKADITVSFIGYKPCHFLFPSSNYCGKCVAVTIGIDEELITDCYAEVIEVKRALSVLSDIPADAHKGTKGTAAVLGGSYGMAGAPMLSAKAAMRSGAGIVKVCLPKSIYPIAATILPEAVFAPLEEKVGKLCADSVSGDILKGVNSLLIGPGMGLNDCTVSAVSRALAITKVPTVIDADGLNALAEEPDMLNQAKVPVIVTPHPGEMSRLIGKSVGEIQKNRISAALDYAVDKGVITVLKGAYTVIALPNGKIYINTTGNAGMATAGSGDMLGGMIAAFLANGMKPVEATVSAVCLHGAAGDLTAARLGIRGMTVSDMIEDLPAVFKSRFGVE